MSRMEREAFLPGMLPPIEGSPRSGGRKSWGEKTSQQGIELPNAHFVSSFPKGLLGNITGGRSSTSTIMATDPEESKREESKRPEESKYPESDDPMDISMKLGPAQDGQVFSLEVVLKELLNREESNPESQLSIANSALTNYLGPSIMQSVQIVEALKEPWDVNRDAAEDREASWNVICQMSRIANFPDQLLQLQSLKPRNATNQGYTVSIFVLRNLLARLAFVTKLQFGIYKVLKAQGVKDPGTAFALVGFNRLFSPQNTSGVSLSSDMDYKLVLDDRIYGWKAPLKKEGDEEKKEDEGKEEDEGKKEDLQKKKEVQDALQTMQKSLKPSFDHESGMVLEVEEFTTRYLQDIQADIKNRKIPAEKNFFSSIYNNHVIIAGSPEVFEKFESVLNKYKQDTDSKAAEGKERNLTIASNTHKQYLGETDKGSMEVIKHIPTMKTALDACADELFKMMNNKQKVKWKEGNEERKGTLEQWFENETGQTWDELVKKVGDKKGADGETREEKETRIRIQKEWLKSPLLFYKMHGLDTGATKIEVKKMHGLDTDATKIKVKDLLVRSAAVKTALSKIQPFKKSIPDDADRLSRFAKVLGGLVDLDYLFEKEVVRDEDGNVLRDELGKVRFKEVETDPEKKPLIKMQYQPGFAASCLNHIGIIGASPSGWRFSIKYAGCRLSDYFDSIPNVNDYLLWCPDDNPNHDQIYMYVKKIAVAINKFSLSMQNCIYLLAINRPSQDLVPIVEKRQELYRDFLKSMDELLEPVKNETQANEISKLHDDLLRSFNANHNILLFKKEGDGLNLSSNVKFDEGQKGVDASHVQIDSLYARITREQYFEMLSRSSKVREELNKISNPKATESFFSQVKSLLTPKQANPELDKKVSEYSKWSNGGLKNAPKWKQAFFKARSETYSYHEKQFNFAAEMARKQVPEEPSNVPDPVDVLKPIDSLVDELKKAENDRPKWKDSTQQWENKKLKLTEIGRLINQLEGDAPLAKIKSNQTSNRRVDNDALFKAFWETLFKLALAASELLDPSLK